MWETLFRIATSILDAAGLPTGEWTFGGGTALALRYKHRESKDIDIFITDAQWLPYLTPRLNPSVQGFKDYEETSNYVKIAFDEGEIDFVVSPHLTPNYFTVEEICGRQTQLETPVEIVIKKLFYRAHALKVRDVVDAAAIFVHDPEGLLDQVKVLDTRLDILKQRWKVLKPLYDKEITSLSVLDPDLATAVPRLFEELLSKLEAEMG